MRLPFTVLTLIILLAGCSDSYDDKDAKFRSFVSKNQMGGKDFFLEKQGVLLRDEWFSVALFYGMPDDRLMCEDVARYLSESYPTEHYRCRAGN